MKYPHQPERAVVFVTLVVLAASAVMPAIASATCNLDQESCSSSYGVSQTHFGTGGQICIPGTTGSAHYCASESAGELGVGNAASTGYQVQAGSGLSTNRDPSLTLIVNNPNTNLGYLSTSTAATTTATFSVMTYLAGGYIVQTVGNPPTSNAVSPHTLTAMAGGTSTTGTEQFGMNLVANTTACGAPVNFGAARCKCRVPRLALARLPQVTILAATSSTRTLIP